MCSQLLHSRYLKFWGEDDLSNKLRQMVGVFGLNVLAICFVIDFGSSLFLVGILMSIPNVILGSIGCCKYLLRSSPSPDNDPQSSNRLVSTLVH